MADKSWMLNPKAIRQAKECIHLIKELAGVKLKLSHPDFVQQLHEFVESTGSAQLGEAYARLISMAGVGFVVQNLKPRYDADSEFAPMKQAVGDVVSMGDSSATVEYSGKMYPKYRSGLEFKGVYRGQPMYS
ncbi:MAG: hypothetical protein K6L81_09915 [Agarilytica sp.]